MESQITLNHTQCNCLDEANENTCDVFIRKVRKSPNLSDSDFRTHVERGKLSPEESDCENICGMNALSFEIWNENSWELLLKKYNTTIKFSPQSGKKNLCVIQFTADCGFVKYTPDQITGRNDFHYDFYKDGEFTVSKLKLIEMVPLDHV